LTDFLMVSEKEIAEAMRQIISTTSNLIEPSGAVGLAGLLKMKDKLAGENVLIVFSGSNVDPRVLTQVMSRDR
jgi:threonine dehydratase